MCYTVGMDNTKQVPDEVRKWFSHIGKKSGNKIKSEVEAGKRPADYYSRISKMRKTHGRQKTVEVLEPLKQPQG